MLPNVDDREPERPTGTSARRRSPLVNAASEVVNAVGRCKHEVAGRVCVAGPCSVNAQIQSSVLE
jgi:hypothetical protein